MAEPDTTTATRRIITVMLLAPHLPPHIGGVENYVGALARGLAAREGFRVVVVSPRTSGAPSRAAEELLTAAGIRLRWLHAAGQISNTPVGLGWGRRLRVIARQEGVDIVHAHTPVPWLADVAARALRDLPFVLTVHSGRLRPTSRLLAGAAPLYERLVLPTTLCHADAVVATSPHVERYLDQLGRPADASQPPAVDLDRFRRASRIGDGVLFVGSLDQATAYKGLDDLLAAMRTLHDDHGSAARLRVVGHGDRMDHYRQRVADLGLGDIVTFAGRLVGDELADAYSSCRVVALPSRHDNFPTVILEAMAAGRPVVACDVGSVRDVVDHELTGLIVPPGRPDLLAEALGSVIDDEQRAVALGRAGQRRATAEFGVSELIDQAAELYARLVGPRPVRVGVVTPHYEPSVGGVENYSRRLARALRESELFEPVVFTTNVDRRTRIDVVDGVPVIRMGVWGRWSNTPVNPLWPITVPQALRRMRIDAISAHAPTPFFADVAVLCSGLRPVQFIYHSGSMAKGGLVDHALRLYERIGLPVLFDRSSEVLSVSPTTLAHQMVRAPIVSPGVDLDVFAGSDTRRDPATILFVGRVESTSRWKGLHVLIQALPAVRSVVPEARLVVAGSGDDVAWQQALARRLGVDEHIDWLGNLDHEHLPDLYRRATVTVLPSLTESESFGMSLVEAMASGCPVVGSDVGGIPFVIEHEVNGLLAPPGDSDLLATNITRVVTDPELAARMGAAGANAASEKWRWELKTAELLQRLEALSARRPQCVRRRRTPA